MGLTLPALPVTAGLGVVGIVMLSVAADQLVLGAARLAARLGLAPIVVGIVVIGFGTSAPELLVSGAAARGGHVQLAIANLTGSNVLNLTLVLGLAAIVAPLAVGSSVIRREAPLAAGSVVLFTVFVLLGLYVVAGLVLSACLAAAFLFLARTARTPADPLLGEVAEFADGTARRSLIAEGVRTAAGLAGTLLGAQLLVSNAADLAARFGVSPQVIGFTLVALGTSLPELITSIQAQRRRESDLVAGNLLGSTMVNSLGGGAVIAFTAGDHRATGTPLAVNLLMIAVGCLVWALLARGHRLTRPEALCLILLYLAALPLLA